MAIDEPTQTLESKIRHVLVSNFYPQKLSSAPIQA